MYRVRSYPNSVVVANPVASPDSVALGVPCRVELTAGAHQHRAQVVGLLGQGVVASARELGMNEVGVAEADAQLESHVGLTRGVARRATSTWVPPGASPRYCSGGAERVTATIESVAESVHGGCQEFRVWGIA